MVSERQGRVDPVVATTAVYDDRPEEFAENWDALPTRAHDLVEQLLAHVPAGGLVLDVGSGSVATWRGSWLVVAGVLGWTGRRDWLGWPHGAVL